MGHKKNLLVTACPRTLRESYFPLIKELSKDFEIVVVSADFYTPPGFVNRARIFEKEGTIRKFILLPPYESALKMLRVLRSITQQLEEYRFDIWLAEGSIELYQRYLAECIVPQHCVRVILWSSPTFLFSRNEQLVRKLLSIPNSAASNGLRQSTRFNLIIAKIRHTGSPTNFLKKLWRHLKIKTRLFFVIARDQVWRRMILAKLVLGKTFPYEGYDKMTQIDSGKRFQHYIFCDEMEVSAHKALFQTPNIHVAQPITRSACRCHPGMQKKSAILSPLSIFIQRNDIEEKYLHLFYRDFKTVIEQTGTESIHLRMHPDETGRWYGVLRDYLSARGMDVTIVDCDKPIHEVMCDYMGMAGVSSCALRDGRASCQRAFIIGLEAASKFCHPNPRFNYGNSEGIGWIREDGSYDPAIFKMVSFNPPPRKSVPDLLINLSSLTGESYENTTAV